MDPRVEIVQGDITRQATDVIVNAANTSLLGGGGVDGAIHRAAGPGLLREARTLGGCPVGEARVTGAYDLSARWVVHTVGPVWRGGGHGEDEALAAAYASTLAAAAGLGARSIAFPLISTGAYAFPVERACRIGLEEIERHLSGKTTIERVLVVCYSTDDLRACRRAAKSLGESRG